MDDRTRRGLTDEEVEREIERLSKSEFVELAVKEQRIRYRRRQRLYQLRQFEKRGVELAEAGITLDTLESLYDGNDDFGA